MRLDEPLTGSIGPSWWPCCGVTGVAVVANRPFDDVFAFMAKKHRKGWKGMSSLPERREALTEFGVTYAVPVYHRHKRLSFKRWMRSAKPGVTYLIDVTGHTMAYRDGHVVDQSLLAPCRAADHRAIRQFMWSATEIIHAKGWEA